VIAPAGSPHARFDPIDSKFGPIRAGAVEGSNRAAAYPTEAAGTTVLELDHWRLTLESRDLTRKKA
jgi:hypothetical protein